MVKENKNEEKRLGLGSKDDKKPDLHYLEFHAADGCVLNCRGCTHFSPLCKKDSFPDLKKLEESLGNLSRLFRKIESVRILGGEPLMNPELPEIIYIFRRYMPLSRITVVTNGLLLSSWNKELISCLICERVKLCITRYPVNQNLIESIVPKLQECGVEVEVSPLTDKFRIYLQKDRAEKNGYSICGVKRLTFLREGKLYTCAMSAMISVYNETFGSSYPQQEGISLAESNNGWQILKALCRPSVLCDYCCDSGQLVEWKCSGKPEAKDWLRRGNSRGKIEHV